MSDVGRGRLEVYLNPDSEVSGAFAIGSVFDWDVSGVRLRVEVVGYLKTTSGAKILTIEASERAKNT